MAAADTVEPAPKTPEFATAFRGYDPHQVNERVKQLTTELRAAAENRDKAVASVAELTKALSLTQQELTEAKAALTRMASDPSGAPAMTERVQTMMRLAEEEIAELRDKAAEEVAATRAEADAYAERVRDEARAEAERVREEARAEVERLGREAEQRRERLDEEAAQRRAAAEKETAETLAARRAEAEKAAAERESAAERKAAEIIADAERRLAEAERNRTQALELRQSVTERLTATNVAVRRAMREFGLTGEDGAAEPADGTSAGPKPAEGKAGKASTGKASDKAGKEGQPA
ncbi:hypothetical protein SAMN05421810_102863 [Amycolatopsis arida]|uniref:DivIVA protein n=1 Tax=Amycolatopsis arida TaxID=587909 RepID=A0A1I5R360_9PSEU|nr:hypothetical protein [Amycolatopsis arida]TDX99062.1 hypothetical protein CLV69_101864 [Amycolatopsis arida]SFP52994.1 hypothetical protein SAMN05421810_102863 [Amycolatopsis arida]